MRGQARLAENLRYVFEGFAVPLFFGVPNLNPLEAHLPIQQVLNLLDDVVFFEAAQAMAYRLVREAPKDFGKRLSYAYELVLARPPRSEETQAALRFIAAVESSKTGSQLNAWQQYAQVLLLTNEVIFVD